MLNFWQLRNIRLRAFEIGNQVLLKENPPSARLVPDKCTAGCPGAYMLGSKPKKFRSFFGAIGLKKFFHGAILTLLFSLGIPVWLCSSASIQSLIQSMFRCTAQSEFLPRSRSASEFVSSATNTITECQLRLEKFSSNLIIVGR